MRWEILADGLRNGLRLVFEDQGPGIPDIALALTAGWTSGTGLGMGLLGAKRLVNEFTIESEVAKGTVVTVTRWQ
jgi:serine/threonine-protein kinase RsbT